MADRERDRLTGRIARFARVGAGLGAVTAQGAARRIFGVEGASARDAEALRAALGGLKGPVMKAAQILATIPDLLPPEFAEELAELQANAPAMGPGFVRRRMASELGGDWKTKFEHFEEEAAHAASLGQVHRAVAKDGRRLAVKLQYPDMSSAIEADLEQLRLALSIFKRIEPSIDTAEIRAELSDRLREELDYVRERKNMSLYRDMLSDRPGVHVPEPLTELSTARLLSMTWLEGEKILKVKNDPQDRRNAFAERLFEAWWSPFAHYAVIHGDPHLGNYAAREDGGLNLLDFGCIRVFEPKFVGGVIDLYRGLRDGDEARVAHAYEVWGFRNLSKGLLETLNLWARFIYAPLLDDRVRTVADGIAPGEYGRKEAFAVRQGLKEHGPVTPPREFVLMDRAAIGLGAAFLHLGAELNFHQMFEAEIGAYDEAAVAARQAEALARAELA